MRIEHLRGCAPAVLLIAMSGVLAAVFSASLGRERRGLTRYASLSGYAGTFADAEKSPDESSRGAAWGLVAEALRQQYPPVQASELLNRVRRDRDRAARRKSVPKSKVARRPALAALPVVAVSTVASATIPVPPAADRWGSADAATDAYEKDPARYPLTVTAGSGGIVLSLRGLSRATDRYILKVAVTNRGADDFFVRDFAVEAGEDRLDSQAFIRLFVEPGRTREGYVVFERPRSGTVVHVALKEDREKGRVVDLTVPYPF